MDVSRFYERSTLVLPMPYAVIGIDYGPMVLVGLMGGCVSVLGKVSKELGEVEMEGLKQISLSAVELHTLQ